jgi:hypothetical protein
MSRVESGFNNTAAASMKSNFNRPTSMPNRQLARMLGRLHLHFDELSRLRLSQSLLPSEQL